MKTVVMILGLAGLVRADWVIEQDSRGARVRTVIGKSALKESDWEGSTLVSDVIVDFAGKTVTRVDHEQQTIEKTPLEEYLGKIQQQTYKPAGSGKYAGLDCMKYSYSYNNGGVGGWGGGTGCYTRAIAIAAPYDKMLERWLQATEGTTVYLGFPLWNSLYVDGPARVNLETKSVVQQAVAASEFVAPTGYHRLPRGVDGKAIRLKR